MDDESMVFLAMLGQATCWDFIAALTPDTENWGHFAGYGVSLPPNIIEPWIK